MRLLLVLAIAAVAAPTTGYADTGADLMQLADEYWESHLRANPTSATSLGDRRYDHLLPDISQEGREARRGELESLLARTRGLDPARLSPADRVTLNALRFTLESGLARMDCDLESWNLGPNSGPQTWFFGIPSYHLLTDDPQSGRDMVLRWRGLAPYVRQHQANLEGGLTQGKVAPGAMVERVLEQLDELETRPVEEWTLLSTPLAAVPEVWPEGYRETFGRDLEAVVTEGLRPALLEYREFLRDKVLPRARDASSPGIGHVPDGDVCYEKLILVHTSLSLSAEDIHRIGLAEVERINQETRELGMKALGTNDLEDIHRRLREDPDLHFRSRDEVQEKAEEALARAQAVMPEWFGILPQAECGVTRMEAHSEKHSTIAFYRRPAADGSRPGSYYINTYAPETRPRYEAEVLAYHEAIPGHHLQIAISQNLDALPMFRRHGGVTAYVEGWALYTERLSDEMGLYSSDMDRM